MGLRVSKFAIFNVLLEISTGLSDGQQKGCLVVLFFRAEMFQNAESFTAD